MKNQHQPMTVWKRLCLEPDLSDKIVRSSNETPAVESRSIAYWDCGRPARRLVFPSLIGSSMKLTLARSLRAGRPRSQ